MKKRFLIICVFFLLIISSIDSLSFGNKVSEKKNSIDKNTLFQSLDGPMDSAWPMHGHDAYHTGRSPFNTVNNTGFEKWRFRTIGPVSSPVINEDGIIYVGAKEFYAIYPNNTLKWKYDIPHKIESTPAIDENGIIYFGTVQAMPNYLYAIYTSNGTLKWKYYTGNHITSSPVIDDDGIIYFGDWNGDIHAVYQNGTRKWIYHTADVVTSSPAIGLDGTIYIGSHDGFIYAFYPDNGTVEWSFNTGSWVHGIPTIGNDGTVYIGSDNGYLYAFYPNNGIIKWQINIGSTSASPALDENGNLYLGVWEGKFYAIYPNGTIKWSFNLGDDNGVWDSSAAISADGTIYFGMCYDIGSGSDGDVIALNPDGTEKWRKEIGRCHSSPAISEDGTIYIGNYWDDGPLFAFGPLDPDAPKTPTIIGLTKGKVGISYEYKFFSTDPNNDNIYYYIDWGDSTSDGWFGPYDSGEEIIVSHVWSKTGTYTIRVQAKDTNDLKSDWGTLEVTMPRNKSSISSLFLRFLERYPLLERLLRIQPHNSF